MLTQSNVRKIMKYAKDVDWKFTIDILWELLIPVGMSIAFHVVFVDYRLTIRAMSETQNCIAKQITTGKSNKDGFNCIFNLFFYGWLKWNATDKHSRKIR